MPKFIITETVKYVVEAEDEEDALNIFEQSPTLDFPTTVQDRYVALANA